MAPTAGDWDLRAADERARASYDLPIDAHVAALAVCDHEAVVARHTCQRPSLR